MQDRWAVMSGAGEWARDDDGRVLTFFVEENANAHRDALNHAVPDAGWTTEPFTVEDAMEEAARSPFAGEGGL
jgi:hypothetical protein